MVSVVKLLNTAVKTINGKRQCVELAEELFGKTFNSSKATLIEQLAKHDICPTSFQSISKANTPNELYNAITSYHIEARQAILNLPAPKGRSSTLDFEQLLYSLRTKRGNALLDIEKAVAIPNTNPRVKEIEQLLKNEYGISTILNNDLSKAEDIYAMVIKAKTLRKPLPNRIIISNNIVSSGENIRINGESTILIESTKSSLPGSPNFLSSSAKESEHTIMHELLHNEHSTLYAENIRKIPKKYQSTITNVGGYASECRRSANEVRTELATKQVLDGKLTNKEAELFEFLNGEVSSTTQIMDEQKLSTKLTSKIQSSENLFSKIGKLNFKSQLNATKYEEAKNISRKINFQA